MRRQLKPIYLVALLFFRYTFIIAPAKREEYHRFIIALVFFINLKQLRLHTTFNERREA